MRFLLLLCLAGCGRFGFGDAPDAAIAGDGPHDATTPDMLDGFTACLMPMTIRDFTQTSHVDFGPVAVTLLETGVVESALGGDRTPTMTPGLHDGYAGPTEFLDWFHPSATSVLVSEALGPVGKHYGSMMFNPIDGLGQGDDENGHNFRFTAELHGKFTAAGGEVIEMSSDDDCWTFIDGALAIDIGGKHAVLGGMFTATAGTHTIDIFYADRGPAMAVFQITTDLCFLPN